MTDYPTAATAEHIPSPIDLSSLSPKTLALLARLSGEVPKTDPEPEPEPPFKYGMTPARRRMLTRLRSSYPQLAREIHVLATVTTAPYSTLRALADECAAGSDLSVRTWQRVDGDMARRGQIELRHGAYVPGESGIEPAARPQVSRQAVRKLSRRVGDQAGPRDPSERAERVHRVLRHGQRKGCYYSSVLSLAKACAKNGSGTEAGYRRVIERMLATSELTRDFTGAIVKSDPIY
jgi:hypothetical protein